MLFNAHIKLKNTQLLYAFGRQTDEPGREAGHTIPFSSCTAIC